MRAISVLALVGGITLAAVAASVFAGSFQSAFDGAPATPLSYQSGSFLTDFDVQVHERGMSESEDAFAPMLASHGDDCSAPPATHHLTGTRAGSVFQCKDHFMTAINGANYGVVYFTPPALVDFSTSGRITFEVSTEDVSPRDWWDVTVSPFGDSQALPLLSALSQGVDLQNPNRNAVVITTDNGEGSPHAVVLRNGADSGLPSSGAVPGSGVAPGTNQAATRQTFALTLTPTHVRFERLASTTAPQITFIDANIPALSWTQGVVQFGHHDYDAEKDGGRPNTFHWDNITVDPFVNLGIQPVSPKYTSSATMLTHTPAPAGAYLRFSAICRPVIDGVTGVKMTDSGHPEHFSSYLMPIAQGSTSHSLRFTADSWYSGPCAFKDASVFSQGGASSSPTPSATSSPSPTPDTRRYRCQVQSRPGATWVVLGTPSAGGVACP